MVCRKIAVIDVYFDTALNKINNILITFVNSFF
jgi:hypothetical protein